ncbi:hypothetical protein WN943_026233 [Citrus x changshan-huyou]
MAPLWCCSDILYQYLNPNVETWVLKRHPYGAVMVASLSAFGLNTTHNSHMTRTDIEPQALDDEITTDNWFKFEVKDEPPAGPFYAYRTTVALARIGPVGLGYKQ